MSTQALARACTAVGRGGERGREGERTTHAPKAGYHGKDACFLTTLPGELRIDQRWVNGGEGLNTMYARTFIPATEWNRNRARASWCTSKSALLLMPRLTLQCKVRNLFLSPSAKRMGTGCVDLSSETAQSIVWGPCWMPKPASAAPRDQNQSQTRTRS